MPAKKSPLQQLAEHGQSVWIDYLSRDLIHQGELERMMREDAVVGVTSNPTIFQKAISQGSAYDEQLKELADEHDPKEVFIALAARDITDACDLLRKVWDDTAGRDGYVSMEVDPNLAYETEATFDQEVLESETPVLVDFWAEWCGPCHAVSPILEKIVDERNGDLRLVKVNIDEEQELARRYGIMSIPAMIIFRDGEPAEAAVGAMPKGALERALGLADQAA